MATEEEKVSEDFYLKDKPKTGVENYETKIGEWEADMVSLAQLAEKAERFDDMCKYLTAVVTSKHSRKQTLEEDQKNLLSVAFKNVVGTLRSSWRTFKNDVAAGSGELDSSLRDAYVKIVEEELEAKCLEVLNILEKKLIPIVKEQEEKEAKVFYLKMCGDYYRYLAEFRETSDDYKKAAKENYENAYNFAKESLAETHPTRLGLALNFSVCHYEILKDHNEACNLAKRAFDEAIQKLDTLNDANYKDSTLIMQLLRDNLTLWTSENTEENED